MAITSLGGNGTCRGGREIFPPRGLRPVARGLRGLRGLIPRFYTYTRSRVLVSRTYVRARERKTEVFPLNPRRLYNGGENRGFNS